jgi:hypothetical protein
MHPRYQPPQNGKLPMSMPMKDWKELWVQANAGQWSRTLAAYLPDINRVFAAYIIMLFAAH